MKVAFRSENIVLEDKIISGEIVVENGIISKISTEKSDHNSIIDLKDNYIFGGFIDIHTHGGDGIDANAADENGYKIISNFYASHGVTGYLTSILTDTEEKTSWCIEEAVKAMENNKEGAKLLGIHLEGPFLNPEYKGAMPEKLLRYGDIELIRRYQKIAKGNIKYITIAPEFKENMEIIEELVDLGIVVALGHSNATFDETMEAKKRGAKSITHLMNAMRPIHQHELGIVGATLMSDLVAETIVDGLHLHPTTVDFILRNKGHENLVAITDCIMATGLPDGDYMLGINEVVVKDGDARLKHGDARAGSTLTLDRAFRNFRKFTDSDLIKAQNLFNKNPADLLGFFDMGSIKEEKRANFTVMDENMKVVMTVVDGEVVYRGDTIA